MFMGPLEQMKPWSMTGVEGVFRFLARVWRLMMEENQAGEWALSAGLKDAPLEKSQTRVVHATIKKVGEDIEALAFNTAISQMMIFVNAFTNAEPRPVSALRTLLVLLSPFAPHLAEELWSRLGAAFAGFEGLAADQAWPEYDERLLIDDEVEIVMQVNGRVRDRLVMLRDATREEIEAAARAHPRLQEWTGGREIKKVVVVPGKLVNVVAP
jgi:leucyl-tRNA synthetase